MQAWQFVETHAPLRRVDIPEPTPGPGEVVIAVKAAGLCHSDVGAMHDPGWIPMFPKRPVVMGHEIAGVVAELGPGVTSVAVGDRVGVCPTAGHGAPGYVRDGGFAAWHCVHADDLVAMPDTLSFELAAIGTDAGMTSYHAVIAQGGVRAGDKVGIIGLGGLGQIGARVAVVTGAEVHVAEINPAVWPLAEAIGARSVVADVAEWAGGRFDVIVDFAGFGTTTAAAVNAVRRDGRIVVVGMGRLETTLSTRDLIRSQAVVVGSGGGTKADVAAVYELLATGAVAPAVTTIGFDDIPAGLDDLHHGRVTGRLVARIAD